MRGSLRIGAAAILFLVAGAMSTKGETNHQSLALAARILEVQPPCSLTFDLSPGPFLPVYIECSDRQRIRATYRFTPSYGEWLPPLSCTIDYVDRQLHIQKGSDAAIGSVEETALVILIDDYIGRALRFADKDSLTAASQEHQGGMTHTMSCALAAQKLIDLRSKVLFGEE
jgi:hypothetical protein